jgi:RNA polymerase sigma factor (sigma-70 family)
VLSAVMRRFRDFAAAEDAVQEALIAAAAQWPREGLPRNPRGWLIQVALRRMTDHIRSEIARRNRESEVAAATPFVVAPEIYQESADEPDDTLLLLFMCCHSSLSSASAIALALRAVGGLTTAEIARAFLVPESTLAQRISRAKQSIQESGVPFELPDEVERARQMSSVLQVIYLVFNEGYTSSAGSELQRVDLSAEAIRLGRKMHELLPADAEVTGLLALMLLTDARRAARTGPQGELVPLDEQDRRLWDRRLIDEGVALVSSVLPRREVGEYQLLAAIAAVHDEARDAADTDWPQILALYEVLLRLADSPMVTLNHAIAVAMVHGPAAGLKLLEPLDRDARIRDSHRLSAVRAHLLERAGERGAAIGKYRDAAMKATNTVEKNYLMVRAAKLAEQSN